ncbi:dihydrofolate reductase family protein [Plantactinospora sp. GCM10030261]|uniref:dihydrofolate reductase family protein n=1 Tax=Plantactinospora sp. GCM10030261 TaxID=3273420 RepID=UPI00361095A2
MASRLNQGPKYVVSRTLRDPQWSNTIVIDGADDIAKRVAEIKEQPGGEVQIHGSGALARSLLEHELIDEYRLWIYPVVVGAGRRLFPGSGCPLGLTLADTAVTGSGVIAATYRRAAKPTFASLRVRDAS